MAFLRMFVSFLVHCTLVLSEPSVIHDGTAKPNQIMIPKVEFYVDEIKAVVQKQQREVTFGVTWENVTNPDGIYSQNVEFYLTISSENDKVLEVVNSSYPFCILPGSDPKNYSFTVKGIFLGYTTVKISLRQSTIPCSDLHQRYNATFDHEETKHFDIVVSVIRPYWVFVDIVTGIMASLVAFTYVNMGVQLDLKNIFKVMKRPVGPSIGFVCQFFFMPLAAYGVSWLLLDDVSLRLGLFTLGCSPGGSMSNFWTLLFNGDVDLSITMTFISTFAALAMMPLWIFTLGKTLFRDRQATIPYLNLAGSLIILTIPIGVGMLIRQYSPRLSKLSEKIIKPVTLIVVVFGVFAFMYANNFIFQLITWRIVLSGMCIAWGGYSFGALMAWIFRLPKPQIVAVSIETAFQNPAVAFVMLMMSLPQPEADLTSVPVIVQLMVTGLPMWILFVVTRIYAKVKKWMKKNKIVEDIEQYDDYIPVATSFSNKESTNNNLLPDPPSRIKIVRINTP